MTKTLIRLYNRNDRSSLSGKCYFIVLPGTFDELSDYDFDRILNSVASMPWQSYTSYAIATCDDIKEEELFWSEIMNYNMHEIKIDVERVTIVSRYKLPEWLVG